MASSHANHDFPKASRVEELIGHAFLGIAGWRIEGQLPKGVTKAVMIAAPHTSNWDLPFMLATAFVFRVRLNWLGKHTLFEGAAAPFMRWLGGVPVDRRAPHGLVAQVAKRFSDVGGMLLGVSPPGTRSRTNYWKSGFYHIANEAQVPIVCGFLDFGRKVAGVGPSFVPTGDILADMERIRRFYGDMEGLHAGTETPIRLKSEIESAPAVLHPA